MVTNNPRPRLNPVTNLDPNSPGAKMANAIADIIRSKADKIPGGKTTPANDIVGKTRPKLSIKK